LKQMILESKTDNNQEYLITGTNPTDHNVITATIDTAIQKQQQKSRRWKTGSPEQWKQFNTMIKEKCEQTRAEDKNIETLQRNINECLEATIGSTVVRCNNKIKITNPQIKAAKEERKRRKRDFNQACKSNNSNKTQMKTQYIESQKMVRHLIEKQNQENIRQTVNQIIKDGGANSNTFWRTRKKIMNHNKTEEYEIMDEEENVISNPNRAKDHIADYFENLYQAREGENSHKKWTHHINNTVEMISKNTAKSQNETPFSEEELTNSIKKLKRNKSTGPDRMPNEIFIEADETTRKIYLQTLNQIYTSEKIPQQWQHGEIKRIHKGKGKKGKCSNERGITLASNFGKLFERLMDDRIKKETKITEIQAGGQKGVSTADHLMILNSIINQTKKLKKKQELHIAFLDVTKAYDKAWLNAILYTLNKSGLQGKNWRIAKELNNNLTATIRTQYGPTRTINIRDSIRQGGVLSVIEYANLMDDIAKELLDNAIGTQQLWSNNIPGCLLWVDDVALIHNNKDELQNMLDTTNEIAKRYRIKFGSEKSQILTINEKRGHTETKIGDQILDQTETYKYLGISINNKGNMEDHIKKIKGKTEAAIQTIFSLAGNDAFHNIEMATIWRLFNTCIIPIITYGAEAWTPTKAEEKTLQRILDNLLKRILKTPITTPSEILTAETGIWDIETQIMKKQILYYRTIMTTKNKDTTIYKVATDAKNPWKKRVENTLRLTDINEVDLITKKTIPSKEVCNTEIKRIPSKQNLQCSGKEIQSPGLHMEQN